MNLPRASSQYVQRDQDRLRSEIEKADEQNRKKGQDVEIAGTERLILTSANGLRWVVVASNDGLLSLVAA